MNVVSTAANSASPHQSKLTSRFDLPQDQSWSSHRLEEHIALESCEHSSLRFSSRVNHNVGGVYI